jgi:hypothetical protein
MLKHFFLFLCLFGFLSLAAQIKPIVIYSGEYCVEISKGYAYHYTKCYSDDSSRHKKHIFELVLLENNEFWAVQNSRNTFQRDSLQFITGRWKIDSQNYVLEADSAPKRFSHFKKVSYRPDYFKRPFFRAPNRARYLDSENYNFVLPATSNNISQEGLFIYPKECFCFIVLTKTLTFPTQKKSLPIQFFFESSILAEIPRTLYELKD